MSSENPEKVDKTESIQANNIHQPFLGLKVLAIVFIVAGLLISIILSFFSFSKRDELIIMLFYGLFSACFLIARARSLIKMIHNQAKAKNETR